MDRAALLIDTSILIDHLRKPRKDKTVFYRLARQRELLISAVTEFEFSIGATPKNRPYVEKLLARLPALPFDSTCVKTAAEIYRDWEHYVIFTDNAAKKPPTEIRRKHRDSPNYFLIFFGDSR